MSGTKQLEIEFKYSASDISLSGFETFCKNASPKKQIIASGYDYFYENAKDPDSFCRHRVGPDSNQLTFKRKKADNNNFIRAEHNIDLVPAVTLEQVAALCSEFGYKYNSTLFKSCFIYVYDWYTLVYYVCFNEDMKELGRFFEIELSESHGWTDEKEAMSQLVILEKLCKPLGISPQSRIRRSLYEMFRKESA